MTERADDPTIADDDLLLRRILPSPLWVVPQPDGTFRVSSAAFLDNLSGKVSVSLASITSADQVLAAYPTYSLVALRAGVPRTLGHALVRDPTADDPAHALICPPAGRAKAQRKADARRMAAAAVWVVLRD